MTVRLPAGLLLLVATLAAGCADDAATFAPVEAEASADAAPEGLSVTASVRSDGDVLRIDAHARNDGPRTWSVPALCTEGGSAEPWSVAAHSPYPYTSSLPIYPEEGCSEVALRPFRPGDSDDASFTWDGSYVHDDGRAHAAPATYRVEVVLEVYDADGQAPQPVVVPFEVRVVA